MDNKGQDTNWSYGDILFGNVFILQEAEQHVAKCEKDG
jgi:hypothetical protein